MDFSKGLVEISIPTSLPELNVLIVHSRWNIQMVSLLVNGALKTLTNRKVNVTIKMVPGKYQIPNNKGSYELPFACQSLMMANPNYHVCIAIGVLIKGSTMHFEYIAGAVSKGLMDVQLKLNKPIIFGVLTCLNEDQAFERCGEKGEMHNHAIDWANTAIEMYLLNKK